MPPDNNYHSSLHQDVDCALCHTQTVLSCINCHLDDDWDNQQKCASAQIFNWKFVMKWDREGDGNEVFHPGTLMTLKYNCDRDGDHPACGGDAGERLAIIDFEGTGGAGGTGGPTGRLEPVVAVRRWVRRSR